MGGFTVSLFLFAIAAITIAKCIRIVPQGDEWIVERLGRYTETLEPGLSILMPFVDSVAYKVTTKDIILETPSQEVISKDNVVLRVNAISFIKVVRSDLAVYGVTDFQEATKNLVQTSLRSIIGGMTLDEALTNREQIKAKLQEGLAEDVKDWGLTLKSVEIQDIQPTGSMQKAMEMQASAERERKAMVTKAEGDKTSAILEAQGKLESSRSEAEAKIITAKANAESQIIAADATAEAIAKVAKAMETGPLSAQFLLGEQYIDAIKSLSTSHNAKTIVLPNDIMAVVAGLVGRGVAAAPAGDGAINHSVGGKG